MIKFVSMNVRESILENAAERNRKFITEFQSNYQTRLIRLVYEVSALELDANTDILAVTSKFEAGDVECVSIKVFSPRRQVTCPIDLTTAHLNVLETYALNNAMEEVESVIAQQKQQIADALAIEEKRKIALSKLTLEEIELLGL